MIVDGIQLKRYPHNENYWVSRCGKVWSEDRLDRLGRHWPGRWLTSVLNSGGYPCVMLYPQRVRTVHRLVLETYVGDRPTKFPCCRHLDGNKENNYLDNLKWGTDAENQQDRFLHGTANLGEGHPMAKFDEETIRVIFHTYHDGYYSQRELARAFGTSQGHVKRICKKQTWKHLWS